MIKLSKKWWYAIKATLFIATSTDLVKILDISNWENISESLLRRIIAELDKSWIVKTIKWRNGWIKIWKELKKISIFDILFSVWEELWISDCTKWLECNNINHCSTTDLLWNLQKSFNWILKLQTLDKILKQKTTNLNLS